VTLIDKACVKRSQVWSVIKALSKELSELFQEAASWDTLTVISSLGEIKRFLLKRPKKAMVLSPPVKVLALVTVFGIWEQTT